MQREGKSALWMMTILMIFCILMGCRSDQVRDRHFVQNKDLASETLFYEAHVPSAEFVRDADPPGTHDGQKIPAAAVPANCGKIQTQQQKKTAAPLLVLLLPLVVLPHILDRKKVYYVYKHLNPFGIPGFLRDLFICQKKDGKKRGPALATE